MIRIFKYFLFAFLFLNLYSEVQSKPVPPGSGEGDVPANILFLIDSSASMQRRISNRDAVFGMTNAIYDSQGDILGGQLRNLALVKFDADGTRNREFGNAARWTGARRDSCEAGHSSGTGYSPTTRDTRNRSAAKLRLVENMSTNDGTITDENIVFFTSTVRPLWGDIVGMTEDGKDCRFYLDPSNMRVWAMDVATIDGEVYLFATGRWGRNSAFVSYNLTRGERSPIYNLGRGGNGSSVKYNLRFTWRIAVNSDASILYAARNHLFGFALEKENNYYKLTGDGNTLCVRCYTANSGGDLDTELTTINSVDVSPDDDNILYVTSSGRHAVQKLSLDGTMRGYTVVARAGTGIRELGTNTEDAGSLNANKVRFNTPVGIHVTSDRILVASRAGTVDVFNENLFTAANKDTAWLQQMGGGAVTRWNGVKQAMSAIVSDTTLTSGAHFGYGHWNAGETGGHKKRGRGGRFCHFNNGCNYYNGWTGTHPDGHSQLCNRDSCLNVGISAEGHTRILDHLLPQRLAWGTDANAFSQMALKYFTEDFDRYDSGSDCQINYVIVIGDGMMRNNGPAATRIAALRDLPNPVRTLFVAYGGGINSVGMDRFDALAVAGSCPGGDADHDDCEPTIVAGTPGDLKTQLTSKIRQILAEKLSFTAPSITATVQEGGSLYQAQFAYEQYGEWKGTILRKTLKSDGTVDHDPNADGNWDAAKKIQAQTSRNIWTAMEDVPYMGNWDNFNTDNVDKIEELFGKLGYQIQDYHHEGSDCDVRGTDEIATGITDDLKGLINFTRGSDYFDYNGDCDITQKRDHVLGDIYHSQLVEIGPPDASIDFRASNEEAYFRATNNYQSFMHKHKNRKKVIYAGSNAGMLHAISAEDGTEEWAFIPPFIAGLLPSIINPELDGKVKVATVEEDDKVVDIMGGGTNAIFGVDGSPVVHDVFIKGYDKDGNLETDKNWHTILFIPYGRGGAGFSVLDVTYPILTAGQGPIHMFSIFNDSINNKVLVADNEGDITEHTYSSGSASISDSLEGKQADSNLNTAQTTDGDDCDETDVDGCTEQDKIAVCQTDAELTGSKFYLTGTASCYKGTTFTFEGLLPEAGADGVTVAKSNLVITERINGTLQSIDFVSAKYVNSQLVITFENEKVYNPGGSSKEESVTNGFNVATSCTSSSGIDSHYDYSQLGETWSAPRVFRIPNPDLITNGNEDTYVAVMGGGMGNTNLCAGSAVFIVNLDDNEVNPGSIYGAELNGGPITIIDTEETSAGQTITNADGSTTTIAAGTIAGVQTPNGSNIGNSLPASPVVVTADTAFNIPWRGAMVYFNDLEGKITKINLTSSTANSAELFDQTTLFRLNANTTNRRYSYFSMDAGVGLSTRKFWLFGGTGNFNNIGGGSKYMDNILYGVKDPHYPLFKHLNNVHIPAASAEDFVAKAHEGANNSYSVEDGGVCADMTNEILCENGPGPNDLSWVVHLDTVDGKSPNDATTQNTYRKVSATPTLFKGQVYFPIYEPPPGTNPCNIGMAYICVADDECGKNNSHLLTKGGMANARACKQIRQGILSELVIFGDQLYANVAGPKEDADTLYSILSASGEVSANRSGWRESGF